MGPLRRRPPACKGLRVLGARTPGLRPPSKRRALRGPLSDAGGGRRGGRPARLRPKTARTDRASRRRLLGSRPPRGGAAGPFRPPPAVPRGSPDPTRRPRREGLNAGLGPRDFDLRAARSGTEGRREASRGSAAALLPALGASYAPPRLLGAPGAESEPGGGPGGGRGREGRARRRPRPRRRRRERQPPQAPRPPRAP